MSTRWRAYTVISVFMAFCFTGCARRTLSNEELIERFKDPEVQEYIETWINRNIINDSVWKQSALFSYACGVGDYILTLPEFNWKLVGVDPKYGHFKMLGTLDDPKHIAFLGFGGRRAIIYSLTGGSPIDAPYVNSNDLTIISSNFYLFINVP